ncbi:epoxide hydrolase family protein [Thermomonospora cellulosilytica]|uniref:Pimeloyl-ACP methyl ester carboxylesterase n=1 Tax=Thermomonospora cellulosilytica TaxID=1411118 RepID=A0A7W3R6W1_9ACTN|nr:epoxide hydrolase family protein [Thermomonospora cellulosilytica]MBA9001859.1 pimeloyl-ACP methyl ester carboxylesterase [Thermomonospora cellulosilytica]
MANDFEIRPFRVRVPEAELADLRDRLGRTRWPSEIGGQGWSRGVPVGYLKELAAYWADGYDWRAWEARLNAHPQFTTEIDGQNVHFLHVRSDDPDALPLILTHGWPGSVVEFLDLIEPLSRDFHLVIPSIPGFGFSGPTREAGWTTERIATAWAELMRRLGYDRYGAQGGDFGGGISRALGLAAPGNVVAVHVNGGTTYPSAEADDPTLTERERARVRRMNEFMNEAGGYIAIQSTRPQTLAYGLTDSPVGQLAWIIDKIRDMTDLAKELPHEAIDRDLLLTDVTIYWLTGTAGSSAALYYEDARAWGEQEASPVPTGVALFTVQDIALRRDEERINNIVHWSEFDRGGHFAAMEAPDLLLADIREFFTAHR